MTIGTILLIGVHALIAWILIEVFVNMAHNLSRAHYLLWHYFVVIIAFAGLFSVYFTLFDVDATAFEITSIGMLFVLSLEWIVFRFLYSGERWFLNWADWILPMSLAMTTIYVTASLW